VEARPGVEILAGVECLGLTSEPDARTGLARVTGVRLHGADRRTDALPARLVVDAGGRRTKSDAWLAEAGIKPPQVETRPCGIFYSSRFYEICEGAAAPARSGLFVGDLGYLRFGNFPADHRIFSLTLSGEACDAPLRSVIDPAGFERVVGAIPSLAPWVADGVSRPISPVHSMADLDNARRFVVSDRRPFALGFVPVGDALIHTNPIYGWGCSLAFVNAYLVADALRRHPSDLHAFALDLDEGVYRDIRIYYKGAILQDVDAAEISATLRRGEDPFLYPGPTGRADRRVFVRSLVQHGVKSVMHEDPKILRAALRGLNLLEMPTSLLGKADLLQRVMVAWNRRAERVPLVLGPGRDEMLALLCRERTTERGERSEPAAAAPTARGR
jgi:hypothetical protein